MVSVLKSVKEPVYYAFFFAFVFLFLGFYFPLLQFFIGADPIDKTRQLFNFQDFILFFQDIWLLKTIAFTLFQAFLSAFLAICVGLIGAWIFKTYHFYGQSVLSAILFLPFILPSFVVILGIILFFGNNGWINQFLSFIFGSNQTQIKILYSLHGILLAHVYYNFPLALKIILFQWEKISVDYVHAGRILGKNSFYTFFYLQLPFLFPAIRSAFIIIFLLCMNSFAIILVLGSNFGLSTVEILIYQQAMLQLDFSSAVYLSLIQLGINIMIISLLIQKRSWNLKQSKQSKISLFKNVQKHSVLSYSVILILLFMFIFILGPIVAILYDSLTITLNNQSYFSFEWYIRIIKEWMIKKGDAPIINSLIIGLSASLLSGSLGVLFAFFLSRFKNKQKMLIEIGMNLPIVISAIIFGIAWKVSLIKFEAINDYAFFILIFIHSIIFYPFWLRIISPLIEKIPPNWFYVRQNLGIPSYQFFIKVILPWLKHSLIAGFLLTFCLSLGEFNATFMLAHEEMFTLPIQMNRAIGSYRFSYASAIGVILIIICCLSYSILYQSSRFFEKSVYSNH